MHFFIATKSKFVSTLNTKCELHKDYNNIKKKTLQVGAVFRKNMTKIFFKFIGSETRIYILYTNNLS